MSGFANGDVDPGTDATPDDRQEGKRPIHG